MSYLVAQELPLNITCDSATQSRVGEHWEMIQSVLTSKLLPLSKKISLAQIDNSLQVNIIKNPKPKHKGFVINLKTKNGYLDFKARFLQGKKTPDFFIETIDIAEQHRGKGVGRACIAVFEDKTIGDLLGYTTISLKSLPSARGFYKALGFTCKCEHKGEYIDEDDDDNLYKFSKKII
jgi:ribosomal protein S18 acetylase RimI-like enzyme